MEKQGVFVLVLLSIIVLFPSQVLAAPYSVELDDLVAQYALEDSAWSGGTWLGNIHVTDFGEPIAPVESFTFEFWGEVVFPEYIDDQAHISKGEVLSNYHIDDFILCPPGSTSCPDIRVYYATGALLSMGSYHRDRSGTITDYTINGNEFHYSRTVESKENEYWQAGFPSGEVYCALVFMHKLEETRPVYQEGSVNVNGARLTIVTEESGTPPVADADGPYVVYVGDTVTLDGSGSTDADDDIVSYLWDLDDDDDEVFETDAGGQAVFTVDYAYLESLELLINYQYTIHLKVTDSQGQSDTADSTLTITPKPALQVAVDIKPGSCPNPVNTKSSGVLPIAILGSDDYDITTIVPTSVRLADVVPLRNSLEDVAGPVSDNNDCNCIEAGPDGFLDLTLKFETQAIVKAIGDVNHGDILTLELTGVLYDPPPFERPIAGADCILIEGKYKANNKADLNADKMVDMLDFAIFADNWLQSSAVDD